MTRTVLEAVKLNVWLASVSSTKVAEVVVSALDEVTTYLLSKVRSVAKAGVADMPKNNRVSIGINFKGLAIFIFFLPFKFIKVLDGLSPIFPLFLYFSRVVPSP